MANSFESSGEADDPLGLFEPEATERQAIGPAPPVADLFAARPARTTPDSTSVRVTVDFPPLTPAVATRADRFRPAATDRALALAEPPGDALSDMSVEVLGPPPPAGSVSFDHVCSVKGLGFVEGVALIQGVCDALNAAGPSAGVPELHGLYLSESGEVALHGPPTSEPPAREMARLLHQLVAPNLMPPAGRLFVGRWVNNDVGGLTEFTSELAYFARPNRQELLAALHARCDGVAPVRPASGAVLRPHRPQRKRTEKAEATRHDSERRLSPISRWIQSHKPEVTAAVAVLASAIAGGVGTWLWERNSLPASSGPKSAVSQPVETAAVNEPPDAPPTTPSSASRGSTGPQGTKGIAPPSRGGRPRVPAPPAGGDGRQGGGSPPPIVAAVTSGGEGGGPTQVAAVGLPILPSGTLPDLRIYTASDEGVEPPRLRSAQILEVLLKGFETRENHVELVVSERGDVQQARMVGSPQRIPDIMLLSRAKQLQFDPALRNGVPVRYRIQLSWNVTP